MAQKEPSPMDIKLIQRHCFSVTRKGKDYDSRQNKKERANR